MTIETVTTSRRRTLALGLAVAGAGVAAGLSSRQAAAQEKLAQAMVQYQEMPKDGAECDKCVNWQAPNACTIVAGTINPKGWCVAYAPKEG